MSLRHAHDIATALEERLRALLGKSALITLHTEPYEEKTKHGRAVSGAE
ncbi:MAG: hypothetical protein LBO82_02550 [Synergistaceae bacterium]|jgi:divalent metal cation (Fe/Co/Zn/Cd) transporter|nr:hypothetical protein [Synergistaceae bacterium]